MLDVNSRTLRPYPSLLPLRTALIAAVNESPAKLTLDEQRAVELIQKMKTEFSKPVPFTNWKDDKKLNLFRLQEAINTNA